MKVPLPIIWALDDPYFRDSTEADSTLQYADLQYIRNTYAEKVVIRGGVWREQSS